mmetsp:Transcript_34969/g.64174  ORF Transcript_34969/g.64174 Transcript_34969/m.64174 type:complete len:104 (-) Transcript_34969:41-352(-)
MNLNQLRWLTRDSAVVNDIRCHHYHPLFRWNIIIVVSHSISYHPRLNFDGADDWMLDADDWMLDGTTGSNMVPNPIRPADERSDRSCGCFIFRNYDSFIARQL